MNLLDAVRGLPIANWSHADQIRFFAWFIHRRRGREAFSAGDIAKCFDDLALQKPSSISPFLLQMSEGRTKLMLRGRDGYRLERAQLEKLDSRYGTRSITIQVTKLLEELPAKVPDIDEREFLKEALICYRHGAFRAAIVMSWNLAFDHLLHFVLKHHLSDFNNQWPKNFPRQNQKARVQQIATRDDFSELKESEVLTICKGAAIITPDLYKILDEKLGKRNSAAHPSTVTIGQIQAEGVIDDLVNNVVLKLNL
jgi:hypothetical protein